MAALVLDPRAAACPQVPGPRRDSGHRLCTRTRCCLRPGRPFWASLPPTLCAQPPRADLSGVPRPKLNQRSFPHPRHAFEGSRPQPGPENEAPGCLEVVPTCSRPWGCCCSHTWVLRQHFLRALPLWGAAFVGVGSRRPCMPAKSMCPEALLHVHPAGCCSHGLPSVHVICSSPPTPCSIQPRACTLVGSLQSLEGSGFTPWGLSSQPAEIWDLRFSQTRGHSQRETSGCPVSL